MTARQDGISTKSLCIVGVYTSIHIIYTYIYFYIHMYVCMYVCMYACMHACMYVCMCIYILYKYIKIC